MKRNSMCCYLLAFLHVFNRADGSLHRIQYRVESVDGNARVIARCAKGVTSALFERSNRVVVIVPGNSTLNNDSGLTDNYLKILSNDCNTDNTVSVVNESGFRLHALDGNWRRRNRDSSYVIMEAEFENLHRIFETNTVPKWSEYLIVTRLSEDSLKKFAISLWQRGFAKLAFLHIKNDEKFVVLRTFAEASKDSSSAKEPEMKSLKVCGEKHFEGDARVRPFSSILCPTRGCYLIVGHVKNDMIGSVSVAESRRMFDAADHIVRIFAKRYDVELTNLSGYERNWTDTLDLVRRDEIDLTYGSFIPRIEGLDMLDIAGWFGFETVMFVDMSHYELRAPLAKIFFPLDGSVWICLILLLGVYSIFGIAVRKAHENKFIGESITYFDIWAILLGQGIRSPLKIGIRVIIGMWMLTSLIINAAYSCALKSSMASFTRVETLKTIDDINNSGKGIAGTRVARELFNNSDDEADREIYERWKIVQPDEVFPLVIQDHTVGVDYVLNVKIHNFLYRELFQPVLYTLKAPILVYPLNFYLKKNHPYVEHFRKLVVQVKASGLVEKWNIDEYNDIEQRARRRYIGRFHWQGRMRFSQLKVAFKIWACGNSLASIVFLYELYRSGRLLDWMR